MNRARLTRALSRCRNMLPEILVVGEQLDELIGYQVIQNISKVILYGLLKLRKWVVKK